MAWDWDGESLRALDAFLAERGVTDSAPIRAVERIGDGHSNLTFLLVTSDQRRMILRRPPPPPVPPGANDMLREARLVTALAGTDVPVARVLATSVAGEVLDVDFYVSEHVAGPVVTTATPPPLDDEISRRQAGHQLVDTLADLHAVDWAAVGLEDLGRPEGFNRRHLRRMARLVTDGDGALPEPMVPLHDWLAAHAPDESGAAIIHNDYRLGNVLLAPDRPGRIAAVLDWELATLGDPLFDLGYLLASLPEPGGDLTATQAMATAMLEPGWPHARELAERYTARSGRDVGGLAWYVALAHWKLAVLYEYSRRRAAAGSGDPYYLDPTMVPSFLAAGHRAAGQRAAGQRAAGQRAAGLPGGGP